MKISDGILILNFKVEKLINNPGRNNPFVDEVGGRDGSDIKVRNSDHRFLYSEVM